MPQFMEEVGVDFVMVGMPNPDADGVLIFASRTLTQMALEQQVDELRAWELLSPIRTRQWFHLDCTMDEMTVVLGKDYPEALFTLVAEWNREQQWGRSDGRSATTPLAQARPRRLTS